ncbi:diguanylate cyclase (GGDEF) domain-containing protein [Thioflavicoccus mobilis 8321]|uniref:Diguanylate cyclase (GGDEF) domain-containing protein n=1 Tax=Thioflavicoccus mobilis 8321 TaxID=765912 RepID=L0GY76_9GAMM|nr:DUF1631 family protein [Thioflavicoccus mobilis]AGA90777.1 diguanylate cyclase (GGDEF) domain-containing protein [Thioflavicoccus mobilis 8321]
MERPPEKPKADRRQKEKTAGGAERRSFPRYQIIIPGCIKAPDGLSRSCVVQNYCNGGTLLQLKDTMADERALALGEQVKLTIQLLDQKGPREIRIGGQVAWVHGDYLGIAFSMPSAAITATLQAYDRENRPNDIGGSVSSHTDLAHCLSRLREITEAAFPDLVHELLLDTIAALPAVTGQAISLGTRHRVLTESKMLEGADAGELLRELLLAKTFDDPCRPPQPQNSDGEFALVELDDFECWLEVSRVTSLLARQLDSSHTAIGERLLAANGGKESARLAALLGPQLLANAVNEFAKQSDLSPPTRQVLVDSAVRVMGRRLSSLYQDLHSELDVLGVPPPPTPRERLAMRTDRSARQITGPARGLEKPQDPLSAPATSAESVSTRQCRRVPATAEPRTKLVRELLGRVGAGLTPADSPPDWLSLLERPLLREASGNLSFFQNSEHPLRAIVDGLAHLQLFRGYNTASPAEEDLRANLETLLKPVRDDSADTAALRSTVTAISALTTELSHRYQRRVELVVATYESRDLARRARLAVADELNRRYAGCPVPALLPELLDIGWRALLERDWLNSKGVNELFETRLALLDALVGALGGRAFDPAPSQDQAALFREILDALMHAAFDPFRRAAFETRLRRALCESGEEPSPLVTMPTQAGSREAAGVPDRPPELSTEDWEHCLQRCTAIRPGDRLYLLDESEERRDLRVAWVRDDQRLFVLVDPRGVQACELTRADLALGLHRQRILISSIDGRPMTNRMVDAMLESMEAQLPHLSSDRSFTGLVGRRGFHTALEQALAMPDQSDKSGIVLMVDVDQFRLINAIHGYETGDRLLGALARTLRETANADILGHLGGDRFAALLPDLDIGDGERLAKRLCESVRVMPFSWPGQRGQISVSVGLVGIDLAKKGPSSLWQAAEQATRAAKNGGGDQVYVYREDDPDMIQQRESIQWVAEVDSALDSGQLRLRCQPITPLHPELGLQPHYEVLLGVTNALQEPLPIACFISAAERYNRMRAVDRWVAKTVVDWIAEHREWMSKFNSFAVNLSGQTVSDPNFVEFVRGQFQRTGIEPAWLSFEITETAAMADLSVSSGILRDLNALGCRTALDDFGSGLASYSYLRTLPVDWVKIEGAFVRRIAADRDDFAVVKSINEIGHFLGKRTIAEYVADREILRCVTEIGVDFAQGYEISPPLLMDELLESKESPSIAWN